MPARESIHRTYFGYAPLGGHEPGCRAGNSGWEVSIATDERYRVDQSTGEEVDHSAADVRLVCRSCRRVVLFHLRGMNSYEYTHVDRIGYGTKPERCAGVWLHAGQPLTYLSDDPGPWDYYVTGSPTPPADESEVLGIMSRNLTPRQAQRWLAGYGQRPGGGAITSTDERFKTKTAAVRWITAEHTRQLADLAAAADHVAAPDGRGGETR